MLLMTLTTKATQNQSEKDYPIVYLLSKISKCVCKAFQSSIGSTVPGTNQTQDEGPDQYIGGFDGVRL
jgi:hypothetical protein